LLQEPRIVSSIRRWAGDQARIPADDSDPGQRGVVRIPVDGDVPATQHDRERLSGVLQVGHGHPAATASSA